MRFHRIADAAYASRSRQAQREIAQHFANRGMALTDAAEREMESAVHEWLLERTPLNCEAQENQFAVAVGAAVRVRHSPPARRTLRPMDSSTTTSAAGVSQPPSRAATSACSASPLP